MSGKRVTNFSSSVIVEIALKIGFLHMCIQNADHKAELTHTNFNAAITEPVATKERKNAHKKQSQNSAICI